MITNTQLSPKVGVQVLVVKDGKFLIGRDDRKGVDIWGVPGGYWENGETLIEAGKREVFEESGIMCKNLVFVCNYEFFREDKGVSFVSIGYIADYISGKPRDDNKEGRLGWQWLDRDEALKMNLYPACRVLIETYLNTRKSP